jgi:four helix bundle protein
LYDSFKRINRFRSFILMATIRRFEDLECWHEARKLVQIVYTLTLKTEFRKDIELVRQVRRSAISSMVNITEGFHRNSARDFMKFLDYSRASVAEKVSHVYAALDQGYITENEMKALQDQADIVWKKTNAFISYLKGLKSGK